MRSEHRGKPSRPGEPERSQHEAPRPAAQRPEGDWGFCLRETVRRLDCSRCETPEAQDTRGAPPCDPAMMVCLWRYADGVGGCASRPMAGACARQLAGIALGGPERPDCRPRSDCRRLPLEACQAVVVPVVRLAGEAGRVRWGHVATEGPQRPGQASRHTARR